MSKKNIPDVLTEEEQQKLLNQFNKRYLSPHRNKTMIRLFLDSGLRLSEMINLKWKYIDLQTGKLKVVEGKGAKDRIVWINENTLEQLREWKERQVEDIGKVTHLFTTRTGKQLKSADIRKMVYNYVNKAGIEKNISPHSLRHTFATDLYRDTNNLRKVQKALGHANISTTQIYTHIVDSELKKALKNFRK